MKGKVFTAQEVQAILAGNKRMFREVIKPYPHLRESITSLLFSKKENYAVFNFYSNKSEEKAVFFKSPYQVGQKIFCKESFCHDPRSGVNVTYKQELLTHSLPEEFLPTWKPAQHMKQEQSRLTLQIKEIRVQRLADISEEDIEAEGIKAHDVSGMLHLGYIGERDAFEAVWDYTHKKPEEKFEANPFVFVYDFEVVK